MPGRFTKRISLAMLGSIYRCCSKAAVKPQKLLRLLHFWVSPIIMLPLALVIGTGVLLMLKKEVDWIQPPTQKGAVLEGIPSQSFGALFQVAKGVPELALEDWEDLDRVDVKPGKGVVKFIAANRWEAQIDSATGEVLQVAYRRSDLIESLHDGSYFSGFVKYYIFLPTGIILAILWGTGIYLFVLPHWKRAQKGKSGKDRS